MQIADLQKELRTQRTHVQKMRLQITMNTEKDTGKYRREKKQLARMMMVLGEKTTTRSALGQAPEIKATKVTKEKLIQKPKTSKVAARKK